MKIGIVGPIWYNIPPKKYGGTELVVYNLVNKLTELGQDVTLFATDAARVNKKVKLITVVKKPLREGKKVPWTDLVTPLLHITNAFDRAEEFDILHIHLNTIQDLFALPMATQSKTPIVFTIHFSPQHKDNIGKMEILKKYSFMPYISISDSQRKGFKLNFVKTVYNGLDLPKYNFSPKVGDFFVWMGRITPWKGTKEAIRAALRANVKLILIGPYDKTLNANKKYFEKEIKPLLKRGQIIWKKDLGFKDKTKIIKKAIAFLNPIKWEEPFGLVMAEAQALGTPVISFARGSAKELIDQAKSGFLVKDIAGMVKKMEQAQGLDREGVAENAQQFSAENMANGYLEAYQIVIKNWKNYLQNTSHS